MEGPSSLLVLIRPNDYMITKDLRDAFLSVPFHADHSRYFLFCMGIRERDFINGHFADLAELRDL